MGSADQESVFSRCSILEGSLTLTSLIGSSDSWGDRRTGAPARFSSGRVCAGELKFDRRITPTGGEFQNPRSPNLLQPNKSTPTLFVPVWGGGTLG